MQPASSFSSFDHQLLRTPVGLPSSGRTSATNKEGTKQSFESRLSGLKNLVAVVRPQHLQRVNLNAVTTPALSRLSLNAGSTTASTINSRTNSARSSSNSSLKSRCSSTTTSSSATSRFESGKVNKDSNNNNNNTANGLREKNESKQQDGGRLVRQLENVVPIQVVPGSPYETALNNAAKSSAAIAKAAKSIARPIYVSKQQTNKRDLSLARLKAKPSNQGSDDKIDHQFAPTNQTDILLASVLSGNTETADLYGKQQQLNTNCTQHKLSNRLSLSENNQSQTRDNSLVPVSLANNCDNNEATESLSSTKLPVLSYERDLASLNCAINDRIQTKPMGQQVLSLMMLDAGLLPATGLGHQLDPPSKRSHVHLHHGSLEQDPHVDIHNRPKLFRNCDKPLEYEGELANRMNEDNGQFEQSNNYHSLQPTHEILQSQVHLAYRNNENLRSISLPSSPLSGIRNARPTCLSYAVNKENQLKKNILIQQACPKLSENLCKIQVSPNLNYEQVDLMNHDQLYSFCDSSFDRRSMASSSCSSLNQYHPPLLALSNELNSIKFDELVRASKKPALGHEQIGPGRKDSVQSRVTATATDHNSNQAETLVEKQSTFLNNDLFIEIGRDPSNENDQTRSCAQHGSDSSFPILTQTQDLAFLGNLGTCPELEVAFNINGSTDQQSRRQHQSRSHSISGHDFHSNGQYQRLKQPVYAQQNVLDGYQRYNQNYANTRTQQVYIPTYQQQQTSDLGTAANVRSPSPQSISSQPSFSSTYRDNLLKYPLDRQTRNQLHSSLDCLNGGLNDQNHQTTQQLNPQNQLHDKQKLHHQQHYASSYVLIAPPANAIINQNVDQDLAAAAIEMPQNPYQQQSYMISPVSLNSNLAPACNQQTRGLIHRAMAQVSLSPLRRLGLNGNGGSASIHAQSGGIGHLATNLHHPIRAGHSSLSLTTSSFILEERLQNEIKKLQAELNSEKEKNEALNSQLNINSSLMAAFEQSLTTLNTRLRQLTALNEKKENEIGELKERLRCLTVTNSNHQITNDSAVVKDVLDLRKQENWRSNDENGITSESTLMKTIEDLKRQLVEKDRLLTDTRLEALSSAHQLEQLESKLNGEHSLLVHEDELDEGVMIVNHSPSDSEAITDSAHFSEINSQVAKSSQHFNDENFICDSIAATGANTVVRDTFRECVLNPEDQQSHKSKEYRTVNDRNQQSSNESVLQQFGESDSGMMCKLMDNLLITN